MAKEEKKPSLPVAPKDQPDAFESAVGEAFGGVTEILALEVNAVSPVLVFTRNTTLQLRDTVTEVVDGKPVDRETTKLVSCPVAIAEGDERKVERSLPIGAVFQKTWAEAKIVPGDKLLIKRFPDATKKGGRGSGTKMHVYGLKVIYRAPREIARDASGAAVPALPAPAAVPA